jgi:hypothetical protein
MACRNFRGSRQRRADFTSIFFFFNDFYHTGNA